MLSTYLNLMRGRTDILNIYRDLYSSQYALGATPAEQKPDLGLLVPGGAARVWFEAKLFSIIPLFSNGFRVCV